MLGKKRFYAQPIASFFLCLLGFSLTLSSYGQTLEQLEAIVSRYPSLQQFLSDPKGVIEYREALKAYMGETDGFDSVYEKFIEQIKSVNAAVPEFADKAWRMHSQWKEQSFVINAEQGGTGLQAKRDPLFAQVRKFEESLKQRASATQTAELGSLAERIKAKYGLLTSEEFQNLNRAQKAEYQQRLGGKKDLPKLADDPDAKTLASFLISEVVQHDEDLRDLLYSGDPDLVKTGLDKLARPSAFKEWFDVRGLEIPNEVVSYLSFSDTQLSALTQAYEAGIKKMKDFRHIKDPTIDPVLLARLNELQGQGIAPIDAHGHLSSELKSKLEQWQRDSRETRRRKQAFADEANRSNALFEFTLYEDPARGTLRLKSDSIGKGLHFKPSPRPFHAFFAGRKTNECVGGRDCENLSPKRWARAVLEGTRNFFTETGDGKMEGMVAITPLTKEGKVPEQYEVIDLMSRAVKNDVVVRNQDGKRVKFSVFDLLVDRVPPSPGSKGLVISDGTSVSQNIAGGEVVNFSPAYLENVVVGTPDQFSASDPIARKIAQAFPEIFMGYGMGGMVYDGMKGDGTKVVRLIPTAERRKWTKEELEDRITEEILRDEKIGDRHPIWKRAQENGIRLNSATFYEERLKKSPRHWELSTFRGVKSKSQRERESAQRSIVSALLDNPNHDSALRLLKRLVDPEVASSRTNKLVQDVVFEVLRSRPNSPPVLDLAVDFVEIEKEGVVDGAKEELEKVARFWKGLQSGMADYVFDHHAGSKAAAGLAKIAREDLGYRPSEAGLRGIEKNLALPDFAGAVEFLDLVSTKLESPEYREHRAVFATPAILAEIRSWMGSPEEHSRLLALEAFQSMLESDDAFLAKNIGVHLDSLSLNFNHVVEIQESKDESDDNEMIARRFEELLGRQLETIEKLRVNRPDIEAFFSAERSNALFDLLGQAFDETGLVDILRSSLRTSLMRNPLAPESESLVSKMIGDGQDYVTVDVGAEVILRALELEPLGSRYISKPIIQSLARVSSNDEHLNENIAAEALAVIVGRNPSHPELKETLNEMFLRSLDKRWKYTERGAENLLELYLKVKEAYPHLDHKVPWDVVVRILDLADADPEGIDPKHGLLLTRLLRQVSGEPPAEAVALFKGFLHQEDSGAAVGAEGLRLALRHKPGSAVTSNNVAEWISLLNGKANAPSQAARKVLKAALESEPDQVLMNPKNATAISLDSELRQTALDSLFQHSKRPSLVNLTRAGAPKFVRDAIEARADIPADIASMENRRLARREYALRSQDVESCKRFFTILAIATRKRP
jgi:hypothetical protein